SFGRSGIWALAVGRFSCRTTVRENTAVISRNVTSTVKMSIMGTSSSSAGRRLWRASFLFSNERRMWCLARASGRGGGRRLGAALGDRVQEFHGSHFQAVDEFRRLGLQERMDE